MPKKERKAKMRRGKVPLEKFECEREKRKEENQ